MKTFSTSLNLHHPRLHHNCLTSPIKASVPAGFDQRKVAVTLIFSGPSSCLKLLRIKFPLVETSAVYISPPSPQKWSTNRKTISDANEETMNDEFKIVKTGRGECFQNCSFFFYCCILFCCFNYKMSFENCLNISFFIVVRKWWLFCSDRSISNCYHFAFNALSPCFHFGDNVQTSDSEQGNEQSASFF